MQLPVTIQGCWSPQPQTAKRSLWRWINKKRNLRKLSGRGRLKQRIPVVGVLLCYVYIPNKQVQAYLFLHSRFHTKTHFHSPLPSSAFVFHRPHQQLVEVPGCACSLCSQTFLSPSELWRPCIIWHDMTWRPSTAMAMCREADWGKEEVRPGYIWDSRMQVTIC